MSKVSKDGKFVQRFTKPVIIAHWVNALAFIMLYISALPMYTDFFNWMYPLFGGPEVLRVVHRIFAVMFVLPIFILLIFDTKSLVGWFKQIISWKKHDVQFFGAFPKEVLTGHADVPKQDFLNAGEKLNSILTILTAIMLICSGFVMWFPEIFPTSMAVWMYPIHNIGLGLATAVIIGHIYLSVGHPNSKPSIRGMIKGDVDINYAKAHHGRWYDEIIAEEEKEKTKKEAS